MYRCALVALFVGIIVPLVIFAKQVPQSREADANIPENNNNQRNNDNHRGSSSCLDEILLLDPESGRPASASDLCFSKNTYQEKASFDLSFRRCSNSNSNSNSPLGGSSSDNNNDDDDWIGIFPSQATTLSRLWVANSWGAFLVCSGEEEKEDDGFMDPTTIIIITPTTRCLFAPPPTPPSPETTSKNEEGVVVQLKAITMSIDIDIDIDSDEVPPGNYRFFLVKGDSGWPYEYKAYSESFRVVTNPGICKQLPQQHDNADAGIAIAIHDYDEAEFRTITSGSKPSSNAFHPEQQQQNQDLPVEDTTDTDNGFFDDEPHPVNAFFRPFLPPSEDEAAADEAAAAMIDDGFFDDESSSNTKVYYWSDIFGDDDGNGDDYGNDDFVDN
jgi:hypothetical protein